MGKRKVCYELYVGGRIAARGDIESIAELLCVSPGTAQRMPYRGHGVDGVEVRPLPVLYEYGDDLMTADEIAERCGVARSTVYVAAHKSSKLKGRKVGRHAYDEFSVRRELVEKWLEEVREQTWVS